MNFRHPYLCEDQLDLAKDDDYLVVRWRKARVFFSFCQRGNSICAHFSAGPEAIRRLRESIEDFIYWAFDAMPWCMMVLAFVKRRSVAKLIQSAGFWHVTDHDGLQVYARAR